MKENNLRKVQHYILQGLSLSTANSRSRLLSAPLFFRDHRRRGVEPKVNVQCTLFILVHGIQLYVRFRVLAT